VRNSDSVTVIMKSCLVLLMLPALIGCEIQSKPTVTHELQKNRYCDTHGISVGQSKETAWKTLNDIISKESEGKKTLVAIDPNDKVIEDAAPLEHDRWRFSDVLTSFSGTIVVLEFDDDILVNISEDYLR
jgi:hypothetical protein